MSATAPWYPIPSEEDSRRLRALLALLDQDYPAIGDFEELVGLAKRDWREADLRRLGKIIARKADIASWSECAAKAGFVGSRLLILSSHTVAHLVETISGAALRHGVCLKIAYSEYTQPEAWLADQMEGARYDAVLVALDREAWGLTLEVGDAANASTIVKKCLDRLERLSEALADRIAPFVVVQNLPYSNDLFQSQLDIAFPGTERNLTSRFNLEAATQLAATGHAVFDLCGLGSRLGADHWNPGRMRHQAKLDYSTHANIPVADAISRLVSARHGKSKRVLVLDLDNTLWRGVIGDDGLDGIQMAPGHPLGEAHRAIQRMALEVQKRGIVLCVASKNTFEIAIEAFQKHPDMILLEENISLFRIDWNDKASNIEDMANALNLGLESFVFLDDNPAERLQVRDRLPAVFVPELPQDIALWPALLAASGCFEQISLTDEDLQRASYYTANAKRDEAMIDATDISGFLKSLDMSLEARPFDERGRARIAQLVAKSNQFNLTTRRYSEREIEELQNDQDAITLQIRLSDRFGDNGMIAVVAATRLDRAMHIDLWLMSCRVLSRKVEEATLNVLADICRERGIEKITGVYRPTSRNGIVRDHYQKLGFVREEGGEGGETFWSLDLNSFVSFNCPIKVIDGHTA